MNRFMFRRIPPRDANDKTKLYYFRLRFTDRIVLGVHFIIRAPRSA